MAFCGRCGQENLAEANYCSRCGRPLFTVDSGAVGERVKDFGVEVEDAGKRLEKHVDAQFNERTTDFDKAFGVIGPVVKAVIFFIVVMILAEVLSYVNDDFSRDLGDFIIDGAFIILLMMVLFSYSAYVNRIKPDGYEYFKPFVGAIGTAFSLWLVFSVLQIIGEDFDINIFIDTAELIWIVLPLVFLLVLLVGFVKIKTNRKAGTAGSNSPLYTSRPRDGRLYRSRTNRVLGGVCAGLAEYFNIDPLITRIIWVLLLLASFGTFTLIYLIMWIVVPKSP